MCIHNSVDLRHVDTFVNVGFHVWRDHYPLYFVMVIPNLFWVEFFPPIFVGSFQLLRLMVQLLRLISHLGQGKSSTQTCRLVGYMFVHRRVFTSVCHIIWCSPDLWIINSILVPGCEEKIYNQLEHTPKTTSNRFYFGIPFILIGVSWGECLWLPGCFLHPTFWIIFAGIFTT